MITYQTEEWDSFKKDAADCWTVHWNEVVSLSPNGKFDPDLVRADQIAGLPVLHIVTAREQGSFVDRDLHHKDVVISIGDHYWIQKNRRQGGIPLKLFKKVQETLKDRGVQMMYEVTTLKHDHHRFLSHLGFTPIERKYHKWIGD
jgi:hypothetical protein